MPFIDSKALRIICFIGIVGALLSAVLYLRSVQNSGTIVATAETLASPLNLENTAIRTMVDRPMADILTRQQTLIFAPITLSPDMGDIRLDIELTQLGIINGEQGFGTQTYTFINDSNGQAVFDLKEKGIISLPKEDKKAALSFTGKKTHTFTVAHTTVPQAGQYSLTAMIEQWVLASPNLSMKLIAKTGTVEADTRIVAGLFGTLFLCLFLLFLTTPPHLRKGKVKHGGQRRY